MINIRIEKKQEKLLKELGKEVSNKELLSYFEGITENCIKPNRMVKVHMYSDKKSVIKDLGESISDQIELQNFKFVKNTYMIFNNNEIIVGTKGINNPEDWRTNGFKLMKYVRKYFNKCRTIRLEREVTVNSKQFFEGLFLSEYNFQKYKSVKTKNLDINFLVTQSFTTEDSDKYKERKCLKSIVKEAYQKISAQNIVRDWVNTTPEEANSTTITKDIERRFRNIKNITVEVYDEEKLKQLNMRGHLTVNRASKNQPKVVKLTYTPKDFEKTEENKIILGVGKGLTYDSGGLSIKPSAHMTNMKSDKGGAITLYGLADILSKRGGKNKVVLYLAFAENMINENSYRPDDVITHKNGVTSHIKNTDAEGRVVIFDSLCLAQEENPNFDMIFSIATLTGAAVYQFGNEGAGMVSKNEELFEEFYDKGKIEEEIFCEAKLHKFMLDGVKDELADISNTGTPNQGCQKAALYLMKAITNKNMKKYIHLDIAGPSFAEKPFGTNPAGGTGFGVRTLFEILR